MQNSTEEALITRTTLDDAQRVTVPAALFGVMFTTRVEPFIFGIARTLSPDYDGGYWDMHSLSNGGFYMAPAGDELFRVRCGNGYEGEMSADAFGIACCLYCYSHLSFGAPRAMAETCAEQYHLLREWMLAGHGEARTILAAIDRRRPAAPPEDPQRAQRRNVPPGGRLHGVAAMRTLRHPAGGPGGPARRHRRRLGGGERPPQPRPREDGTRPAAVVEPTQHQCADPLAGGGAAGVVVSA